MFADITHINYKYMHNALHYKCFLFLSQSTCVFLLLMLLSLQYLTTWQIAELLLCVQSDKASLNWNTERS